MTADAILRLLPAVFQRTARPGSPLVALLDAMAALHAPAEAVVGRWGGVLDPRRTDDALVPYLASWLDLDGLLEPAPGEAVADAFPPGLGRLRELVAAAARLARWRGTARGLVAFLETATGVGGFVLDERVPDSAGRPRPFHVRVVVPAAAERYSRLVARIVEREKPAFVTHELAFAPPAPP